LDLIELYCFIKGVSDLAFAFDIWSLGSI